MTPPARPSEPSESRKPSEVVRAVMDGVSRLVMGDDDELDRLPALFAEPTYVIHPMTPAIPPLTTRAGLREHFAHAREAMGHPDAFAPAGVLVHETTDPEVVVAEFHYEITRDGATRSIPCVFVTRVRDGQIVESRDHAAARP